MVGHVRYFTILAIITVSNAVKIDMQGSLRFGKDIVHRISHYMYLKNYFNGRRAMLQESVEEKSIYAIIKSANLCRNLDLCKDTLNKFISYYVIMLAEAVTEIFNQLLFEKNNKDVVKSVTDTTKPAAFDDKLKESMKDVKKILNVANYKIKDGNEGYIWAEVFKEICSTIQETAILFVSEILGGNSVDVNAAKKKLTQQIVIKTIAVEAEFLTKLCSHHKVCSKTYECTTTLNTMLSAIKTMDDEQVKTFIRVFHEILPDTSLYSKLGEDTANEFQLVLNDMIYSDKMLAKNVLLKIHNTVEYRLNSFENNYHIARASDVELVNAILSDMDHIYSKNKRESFNKYLSEFSYWKKGIVRLQPLMKQIMKDISKQISSQSDDLIRKLINEVRAFLEITIDPHK